MVIFAVNRSADEVIEFDIDLQGFKVDSVADFSEISGYDVKQVNTKVNGSVMPRKATADIDGNMVKAVLKPLSWNMIRVSVSG